MFRPAFGPVTDEEFHVDGPLFGDTPARPVGKFFEDLDRVDALSQLCEYCGLIAKAGAHIQDTILRL